MSEKDIAVQLYLHEHPRWNQWALFFFGSIVSVFVVGEKAATFVPVGLQFTLAAAFSCLWVLVAQSIRASTAAWRNTIKRLEQSPSAGCAFALFDEELNSFNRWKDLGVTLKFWKQEPYLRVTRILALVGVICAIFFTWMAVRSIFGPQEQSVLG